MGIMEKRMETTIMGYIMGFSVYVTLKKTCYSMYNMSASQVNISTPLLLPVAACPP